MNNNIKSIIKDRKSWLCVGLDISPDKLGSENLNVLKDHTYKVIDATREFAVAYKPNFAFFERWGAAGFTWLEETVSYIGTDYIKIADAKRGDIGNTAEQYAESIFNHFNFDYVTLNPYMGKDSIEPFLNKPEKGAFILCRTSNPSAKELQNISKKFKINGGGVFVNESINNLKQYINYLGLNFIQLHGEEDNIINVKRSFIFEEKIKNVKFKIYPKIGHLPMYEDPVRTASDIKEFFRDL